MVIREREGKRRLYTVRQGIAALYKTRRKTQRFLKAQIPRTTTARLPDARLIRYLPAGNCRFYSETVAVFFEPIHARPFVCGKKRVKAGTKKGLYRRQAI
ncbi:MAG: hypothetical protein FWG62_02460 [Proteobacteria bacterium]|nr:hypothetical protein [Pseudomonadota bacterium]